MVFDQIKNLHRYRNLVSGIELVERFLEKKPIRSLSEGRLDLEDDKLFLMVFKLKTKKLQGRLECHKRYADIHIVNGQETVYFAARTNLKQTEKYNKEKDVEFYSGKKLSSLILDSGKFAIFFPGEPHEPGCTIDGSRNVKKLVFKILMV